MSEMIISNLIHNPEYFIKVFHHLEPKYFADGSAYRDIFSVVSEHYKKYEARPTKLAISLELDSYGLPQDRHYNAKDILSNLRPIEGQDLDVMIKMTETYIKKLAYYLTIADIVEIYDNEKKSPEQRNHRLPTLESTQDIVAKALAISFENKLGHSYNEGFEERVKSYKEGVVKIPFRLNSMNLMTSGGVERKTENIVIAPTGVGKSMFMCSLASDYMMQGYNVLYITLEMGELQVSKRIDANILDISLSQMTQDTLDEEYYLEKARDFQSLPHVGKLKIKEYASRTATVNDFNALLDDYKIKEDFRPDIIIVDYLMIIKSTGGSKMAEHERLNRLAVELRAMASKYDVALWTAMQTNRDGNDKSDLSLSDIAGSFDVSHHADFIITLTETDDGIERRTQRIKTVKNRYGSKDENGIVDLFVTKGKQRYEDLGEFNSTPANVPPSIGVSQPVMITDEGIVPVKEEKKSMERILQFATDDSENDIESKLNSIPW